MAALAFGTAGCGGDPGVGAVTAPDGGTVTGPGDLVILEDGAPVLIEKTITQHRQPFNEQAPENARFYTLGRARSATDVGKLTPKEVYVELSLFAKDRSFADPTWTIADLDHVELSYRRARDERALFMWELAAWRPGQILTTVEVARVEDKLRVHVIGPVNNLGYADRDIRVELTAVLPNQPNQ
jgi:hypothetical protein